MSAEVIKLATSQSTAKTCKSCAHLAVEYGLNECRATGYMCSTSRKETNLCGHYGRLWTPNPPKPPTFWSRLGDAIIARIRGEAA